MDLIDRQAAIDALNKRARDTFTLSSTYQYYLGALHDVADDIKQLPSAQPDIIMCKDCKHYQEDHLFKVGFCDGRQRNNDDFCSRAERRTDETD